jgi:putative ABC transport system permease protein
MLLKKPGFTLIAVITLALGIGATTAIFSAVNAVLLRALPYEHAERVVFVSSTEVSRGIDRMTVSPPNFHDWREQNQVFDEMAAFLNGNFTLTGDGEPEQFSGTRVSPNLFTLLGAEPLVGRSFLNEEEQVGRHRVVVLSYGLWQRRFGADPGLVGKTLTINGNPYTVVGIMRPDFQFPNSRTDVWMPLAFAPGPLDRGSHFLTVIARLKPGVTPALAQTEMAIIARRLEQFYKENQGVGVSVRPLREELLGGIEPALLILFGAVGFVLLIACANVANLLLARAAARRRESAIRLALGASRPRLIRQLLTESVLLSLLGGASGLLLARWGVDFLLSLSPNTIPHSQEIGVDGRVLAFTFALSLVTGVLFGLAPALEASKIDLNEMLKEAGQTAGGKAGRHRTLRFLLVSEVALALVLLIGAGLLINSFLRLRSVNLGFDPERLLTMQISLPGSKYKEGSQRIAFFEQVLERVESLAGVESVGATNDLPLGGTAFSRFFMAADIEGVPMPASPGELPPFAVFEVSPHYFSAMGTPLLKGRLFTAQDNQQGAPTAIINETVARRFFSDQDPIGKRIRVGSPNGWNYWMTIVGVVGDTRLEKLSQTPFPEIYTPHSQGLLGASSSMVLAVRSSDDPLRLAGLIREQVWAVDKNQPVSNIKTMEQLLSEGLAEPRFNTVLLGIFAVVALALSMTGVYGVASYSVSQRTREIGIRMALGAKASDVVRLVVGQGMKLALIGVVIGLVAAFALTHLMKSLLYGVDATDPLTFASIALLLPLVALLSSYIPARRAAKVDPMVALRRE